MVGIDDSDIVPGAFGILQNYPNPFNGSTSISYSIKSRGHVTISMYNIVGQRIGTLFDGETEAGEHKMTWDARTFPSGVYFARLESGGRRETIKMVVLK
jgi:flagellar hook assembly protein FlgD